MNRDQNTVRHMASLLDGVLIEFAVASWVSREKAGKDALLIGWECDDRTHCGWKRPVLPTKAGISTCWLSRLILHVLNSSPGKNLRLDR